MPLDLEAVAEKMNLKELIAITAGIVGSKIINDTIGVKMDSKTRDLIKIGIGVAVPFLVNTMAERGYGAEREIVTYLGLLATAIASDTIAERIKISVEARRSARVIASSTPVVVVPQISQRSNEAKRVVSI